MDKQSALDVAYEWLIQHPQVDDEEVDWAREAIQGMIDENSALASWQCLYTDGKEGIVCDDYGSQHCAKQAEIDELRRQLTQLGLMLGKNNKVTQDDWIRIVVNKNKGE